VEESPGSGGWGAR